MFRRVIHSPGFQVAILTIVFAAVYPFVRSLPSTECAFLHYDKNANAVDGSLICGTNEATFLDLTRLSFPVSMELIHNGEAQPGKPAFFTLSFKTSGGKTLMPWELAIVHTEKIHLLVVDPSLEDYHHVHPVPVGDSGQYTFDLIPERSGAYHIYAEIVPLASKSVVVTKGVFEVDGTPGVPQERESWVSDVGDYRFKLSSTSSDLQLDAPNNLFLTISRPADGQPVALERIMDAFAHMVAFDEERHGFAHMHPLDDGTGVGTPQAKFGFTLNTDIPGYYKVWAQVQIAGEEVFAPFDVVVGM